MILFDFSCKNKDCPKHGQRFSRGYPNESTMKKFKPVCDSCKQECKQIKPVKKKHAPAGIAIKGDFGTPIRGNKGFAKGLTSKDPADLKRDLDRGSLFH